MPHLFEPLTLRDITFRNRVGVSPMCQYSSEDGFATDWHLVHLGSRAVGGAGMVMAEATAVEPRGRISPQDLGIWQDEHIDMLARVTDFIRGHGAVPAIQLAHAGRKAGTYRPWEAKHGPVSDEDGAWQPVGASAVPFAEGYRMPHELTVDEIAQVQQAFVDGAVRADRAGFDMVEVHAAHGYLLHSFYSPVANHRTDEYGGSFAGRTRMLLETVQRVRAVWPDEKPVAVRLSASDWVEGGWTAEDSVALAKLLKDAGADIIDCSSGGIAPDVTYPVGAGYQVPLSEAVRHGAEIPTATVGMITQPMQADELVRNGRADMVLLGREMLRDPYWVLHAADVLHQSGANPVPSQYLRAF
ncbi:MAG: NADH:flavin oxidoreductase/NADH oxidase [Chloroflexota bacterium]